MIRKNGLVSTKQIYKVLAFIREKKKNGEWAEHYHNSEVIIGNYKHAYQVYMHELNKMKPSLFYNSDTKKAQCALFVPHIHEDGSLAYWPEDGKYLELFKHNE